jgi:SAM-dependent methyltransferase
MPSESLLILSVNYLFFHNGTYLLINLTRLFMQIRPDYVPHGSPGGIWAERWRELKEKHLESVNIVHEGDYWMDEENVRRYLENTRGQYGEVVSWQLGSMVIHPGCRVLDIGSGPGTLAVPLAKLGCRVTVVEQSPLMCAALEEYRAAEKADPITIIHKRWEEVRSEELSGPFDVIIASFSLTMTDIAQAIRTIQQVGTGLVYLYWFLTPPSWAGMMKDLWPLLHKKEYYPTPLADCLWNVLYEMGIYANVEVMDPAPPRIFDSIENAVKSVSGRLLCTEKWQIKIVRSYFTDTLLPTDDGRYFYEEGNISAKIWWDNARVSSHSLTQA